MNIFDLMKKTNSNELMFFEEASVSLKAVVAIDDMVLGPALASARIFQYPSEEEAVKDALSQAFYNTYRSALLRRSFGGGSIALIGDPRKVKSEMYFRALGIFLNKLNGKIFLSKGPGISSTDMNDIYRESQYILGLGKESISSVLATSKGMIWGLRGVVKELFDKATLEGLTIAVHGVGEVGSHLIEGLLAEKANIIISDIVYDKIKVIQDKVPNIKVTKPEEIYRTKCDIFCTCAFNGAITEKEASQLNCRIISGSVNTIFDSEKTAADVEKKDILHIPGFVINTGEIIKYSNDLIAAAPQKTEDELSDIYYIIQNILRKAIASKRSVNEIALEMAQEYLKNVAAIKMLK